ncbi:MAG: hypothetical protein LLG20_04955 [Acidobacteriales bacterium]|nr:hypothetical protein [Terriglobales bacterium]
MPIWLRARKSATVLCVLLLLIANLFIVWKLFAVEYSAYTGSIEGTFIAIARVLAEHPGEWKWWPFWNGGMPFEVAYLPFMHWIVAAFSLATGLSAARSFHMVTASLYVFSALAVFWMALELSRRKWASFIAALAYSCLSVSALLIPAVGLDAGGPWNLRRLQILVFYGESPHTIALALLPVAVVCFHRGLTTPSAKWKILAGMLAAFVVLSNAFGIVEAAGALICWVLAYPAKPWWKAPLTAAVIGVVSYCWISPWLSFSMIRAMRANAATSGGDFRYTASSWIALAILSAGYVLLWWILRKVEQRAHVRFFVLLAYFFTAIVLTSYIWQIAVIPQPHRYQLEMDMALLLAVVFAAAAILDRFPRGVRAAAVMVLLGGLAIQTVHAIGYARKLIRPVDHTRLSEYKIAKWLDEHRRGERTFVAGSTALLFNAFTNNPQLHGGHDQHTVNSFIPIVDFTIRSGMNAGSRDAEYAVFWLKAFGARTVVVSGPGSTEFYRTFLNPRKFDGVLPALWREGGDVIYDVPGRAASLAHVMPAAAVPAQTPVHGLDIAPVEAYVAALNDPAYPPATFEWEGMNQGRIRANLIRGQVVAVQVAYERGWEAWANGKRQPVRGDAIGQTVIEPECAGPCEITMRYTGGNEAVIQRIMSLAATLGAIAYAWAGRRRRRTGG